MGRQQKVYPEQIREFLDGEKRPVTVKEIADFFGCTPATIRKKLKMLRKDGVKALPTSKGIYLYSGQITEVEIAALIAKFGIWLVTIMLGCAQLADIGKKPLLEAKKLLLGSLTKEEQRQFRAMMVLFKNAIDLLEIEEAFTPFQLEMSSLAS